MMKAWDVCAERATAKLNPTSLSRYCWRSQHFKSRSLSQHYCRRHWTHDTTARQQFHNRMACLCVHETTAFVPSWEISFENERTAIRVFAKAFSLLWWPGLFFEQATFRYFVKSKRACCITKWIADSTLKRCCIHFVEVTCAGQTAEADLAHLNVPRGVLIPQVSQE